MADPAAVASRKARSPWLAEVERALWEKSSFRMVPDLVLPAVEGEDPARPSPNSSRVAFAGFPSDYSVALLLALLRCDIHLTGIATSLGANPVIAGENALSQIADHLQVPLLRLARVNEYDSLAALRSLGADLVVLASFDQILHRRALAIPKLGWLNIHPSLLPSYRGPEPVYWAIVNGEQEAGVSFQKLAPEIDAGPLLAQISAPVLPDDTSGTLSRRLTEAGAGAMSSAVSLALSGSPGEEMDLSRGSYYTSVGHRRIDQEESAVMADRLVRAGNPNMLAATACDQRLCYVLKSRVVDPGDSTRGPRLHFSDGDLLLEQTEDRCGCHHSEEIGRCPHDA